MRDLDVDSAGQLNPICTAAVTLMDHHSPKHIEIPPAYLFVQLRDFGQQELEAAQLSKHARRRPLV